MRSCIAATLACGLLATPLVAQDEAAPDERYEEVVDVHVVNVEVVVTDKEGKPVTGLTREDFELYEDGQPMVLTNFFAAEVPSEASIEALEEAGGEALGALPVSGTSGLKLVIFVDQLNIGPQNRKLLFERLRQELRERAAPGTEVMVATMGSRLEIAQPFTDDLDQVFAVLDEEEEKTSFYTLHESERRLYRSKVQRASLREFTPQTATLADPLTGQIVQAETESDPDFDIAIREAMDLAIESRRLAEQATQRVRATIGALGGFCDTLGGMAGRKALLYLSDGLPTRPADPMLETWTAKFETWSIQNESDIRNRSRNRDAPREFQQVVSSIGTGIHDLSDNFEQLAIRASDDRVAFYPISNAGRGGAGNSASVGGGNILGGSGAHSSRAAENLDKAASLLQIAEDTGGQAMVRSANLGLFLDNVRSDFENFYSLGYSPPHGGTDEEYHDLQVKVRREGLRVRHFKGYRNKNWRQRLGEMTAATALYSIESNPLSIEVTPGEARREGKLYRVPITVLIPFEQIRLIHQDKFFNAQLTVLVLVRDEEEGGLSETRRFDLPIKVPDNRVLEALQQSATYQMELEMKAGKKRVAIGVHDHLAQTESTVKTELVVGESPAAGTQG